jgi:hypothetical protein
VTHHFTPETENVDLMKLKQYLRTNHFLVDNRYLVIKSPQKAQLYFAKVFDKQFSCHDYIKNNFSLRDT